MNLYNASSTGSLPGYRHLYESGELQRRSRMLRDRLQACDVCPRACGVDRLRDESGYCRSPLRPLVASACAHRGEEPPLSGTRGSGTVFFANCNLRCLYCQNYQISQNNAAYAAEPGSTAALADIMVGLQQGQGCHNINLVSPTHFVPQIVEALCFAAARGLRLPLVYNTNAYDSVETLRLLDGVVDVYLPDTKYASNAVAARLSSAADYVERSRHAIGEMYRQVGSDLVLNEDGTVLRGLIVRHLVLPGGLAGSRESLAWLARSISTNVTLSIMSQYHPAHHARGIPLLSRRVTAEEYRQVVDIAQELGFENIWSQTMEADRHYLPDFSRDGHPFE
ncbi:MAG: radical SAM protein [Dehalococcoidia bacterium]|nr:radical SAM protein [Dehalococcoidia bacterium]